MGYAPIAIPLLIWGAILLVLARGRRGQAAKEHEKRRRDLVRAVLIAVVVLVVMWLPAVIQQLVDSPGNLTEVLRYFTRPQGPRHTVAEGYRVVAGQFGVTPQ